MGKGWGVGWGDIFKITTRIFKTLFLLFLFCLKGPEYLHKELLFPYFLGCQRLIPGRLDRQEPLRPHVHKMC